MCGIVGYLGHQDAVPILIDCLKRLEYRGYDSAGIGVLRSGKLHVRRCVGKIANLERVLQTDPIHGNVGVAHTRWATHGKPSDGNAHPHLDCSGALAVVHNGIIENFSALKKTLKANGHRFASETDTEVIAHLIEQAPDLDFEAAVRRVLPFLTGAYALGIISERAPGRLFAARHSGPPLVVGLTRHGLFLASDIAALLSYTKEVVLLEDGDLAVLSRERVRVTAFNGKSVRRAPVRVQLALSAVEKNGHAHFMLKEIHEQPRAIEDTYGRLVKGRPGLPTLPDLQPIRAELAQTSRIILVACGSSWHAALVGKHMLEALCRIPVEVDYGSEFRYRSPIADRTTLTVAISQSGETADTLGALREARSRGAKSLAICNVAGSSLSREADAVLYTYAGPEIGVASTKAFTSQLVALYLLAIHMGAVKGLVSLDRALGLLKELEGFPSLAESVLSTQATMAEWARKFYGYSNFLYLGRGINYALALEGALKLKEVSYIHAEGYPAGELKHGPIALIDRQMPVVVLAPRDSVYEKTTSNLKEVKARDGIVLALASEGDEEIGEIVDQVCYLPRTSELTLPILLAIPLQLLAYDIAVLRHCDVDQPRNLAKSVTVE